MKTSNHSQNCILKLLESSDRAISAQNIWTELQKQGEKIGVATIYRNLETLKLKGLVQARTHHHEALYSVVLGDQCFATCLQCGDRVPLPFSECPQTSALPSPSFQVYYHTLEVFGLCSPCKTESHV